jgi:hypothetical protein
MAITYNRTSPYANTDIYGFFLDVANIPKIAMDPNDVQYQIDAIYKNRPDLQHHRGHQQNTRLHTAHL